MSADFLRTALSRGGGALLTTWAIWVGIVVVFDGHPDRVGIELVASLTLLASIILVASRAHNYYEQNYAHLRRQQLRIATMSSQFPGAVIILDNEMRIIHAGGMAFAALNRQADRLIGESIRTAMPDSTARAILRLAGDALRTGEARGDVPYGDALFHSRAVSFPIDEHTSGVVWTALAPDIVSAMMIRPARFESERDVRPSLFLASYVAHDLDILFDGIKKHALLLADDTSNRRNLQEILVATMHGISFVRRLKALSGGISEGQEVHDLRELVQSAVSVARPMVTSQIRVAFPSAPVRVLANPAQINQALINVIQNSAQARAQTIEIELTIRQVQQIDVIGVLEPMNFYAVVTVCDDGIGIPSVLLPTIFEPYVTSSSERGRGLGLAATRGILHSHRGWAFVQHTSADGTEMALCLPVYVGDR